jgi:hypothetical protein
MFLVKKAIRNCKPCLQQRVGFAYQLIRINFLWHHLVQQNFPPHGTASSGLPEATKTPGQGSSSIVYPHVPYKHPSCIMKKAAKHCMIKIIFCHFNVNNIPGHKGYKVNLCTRNVRKDFSRALVLHLWVNMVAIDDSKSQDIILIFQRIMLGK